MRGETAFSGYRSISPNFNPLSSCEGRRTRLFRFANFRNFNPLPSCEGRRSCIPRFHNIHRISIHSPHARGDSAGTSGRRSFRHFNPLPSCEGRRGNREAATVDNLFQSTPLMRGETNGVVVQPHVVDISIHSPHARGDGERLPHAKQGGIFQSTPLMRGETVLVESIVAIVLISIHSPHARGDPLPDGWGIF